MSVPFSDVYWREIGEIFHDVFANGEFTWTFPNLYASYLDEDHERFLSSESYIPAIPPNISSPWFRFQGEQFRIALMPNGRDNDHQTVGLYFWQSRQNSKKKRYQIDLFFQTPKIQRYEDINWLQEMKLSSIQTRFYKRWLTEPNADVGSWKFCYLHAFGVHHAISSLGRVTVRWKMSVLPEPEDVANDGERNAGAVAPARGIERLQRNFANLFQDGRNSDVILKVDGREFKVYRGILAARSPVFASMFQHDMAEKNSDCVDIPDCSSNAFEVLLRYLYTGSTYDAISTELVFDLYYAADKYQVHDLKEDCLEFVKKSLSVDNFGDNISLAWRHCESGLLKFATDFFLENWRDVIKTVQWQRYSQQNPFQANELLTTALNSILHK